MLQCIEFLSILFRQNVEVGEMQKRCKTFSTFRQKQNPTEKKQTRYRQYPGDSVCLIIMTLKPEQRILYVCSCVIEFVKRAEEKINCDGLPSILSILPNELHKFNNRGAPMQDSIYHMTLKSHLTRFSHQNVKISLLENATFLWSASR